MAISTEQLLGVTAPSQTPSEISTEMVFDNLSGLERGSEYQIRLSATGLGLDPVDRWGWFNPIRGTTGPILYNSTPFTVNDANWQYRQPYTDTLPKTYNGTDTTIQGQLRGAINAPIGLPYFSNNDWTATRITPSQQVKTGKEGFVCFGTYIPFDDSFTLTGEAPEDYTPPVNAILTGVGGVYLNSTYATFIGKFYIGNQRPDNRDFRLGDFNYEITGSTASDRRNFNRGLYPRILISNQGATARGVTFNSGVPATVASTQAGVGAGNLNIKFKDTLYNTISLGTDSTGRQWYIIWAVIQFTGIGGRAVRAGITIPVSLETRLGAGRWNRREIYVDLSATNLSSVGGVGARITT